MEQPSSLQAYVEAQDRLDREAKEMFPYDFSSCSIDQGYVKQQVFACRTCIPADGEMQAGGVCYSCSITCHGEHELVELFNRRHFQCDCGSSRMGGAPCCITKETRPVNEENTYNDNYNNIFCVCKREYDASKEDSTMYQCLLCEDWFHEKCIATEEPLPPDDAFEYYLCRDCTDNLPWLRRYRGDPQFCATSRVTAKAPDADVEKASLKRPLDTNADEESERARKVPTIAVNEPDRKVTEKDSTCCWARLEDVDLPHTSLFLLEDFREQFCKCVGCEARLAQLPALQQEEDVYDPPEDADDDNESSFDAGTRAMESTLQALPRDKAIEGLLAYNKLKDHITACLKPLAEKGEIVTSEHVREFFNKK